MKLTCGQMDILISFYMENELSPCLKQNFEEHQKLMRDILNERQNNDVKFSYEEIKKKTLIKKNYI